ncbi:hypothetical protein QTP86_028509 [Hemibagrus guttatus]|nr:hypothetical protein QTP86_028509 [Hemibagrus guttatus]
MRASTLTFIFIIFEYSIITGGDGNCGDPPEIENAQKPYNINSRFRMNCTAGYKREAGTSNLFKCENNTWKNSPSLKCIRLNSLNPSVSPSQSSPTPKTTGVNYKSIQSTATINGKIVFTTTNKASTTSRTSPHTSQRTTTMEETSVTTSITARITASSTTEREKLSAMCTPSSLITTSTVTGGIVVVVILGVAAAVAMLLLRRRSRLRRAGGNPVDMTVLAQGSEQPLIKTTMSSCPPDSTQSPVTLFKDATETMYTDSPLSA